MLCTRNSQFCLQLTKIKATGRLILDYTVLIKLKLNAIYHFRQLPPTQARQSCHNPQMSPMD